MNLETFQGWHDHMRVIKDKKSAQTHDRLDKIEDSRKTKTR